jgi:putative ABC transport system permease protein
MLGVFNVTMVAKDKEQEAALREEIKELYRKYNTSQDEVELIQLEQPRSFALAVFQTSVSDEAFDWKAVFKKLGLTLLVLLLVPALNLSGMIAGRMETRLSEMGVRKSFGAHRNGLLGQVMWENLLLTLAGGMLGLMLAWTALYACRDWLFALFDDRPVLAIEGVSTSVSGEMLFAPSIFLAAFLLCLLLNLLSALIPAWNSLRNPIIQSLNEKR